jgi:desulfoferrodoxin (superoxide reductase-like protein)
MTPLLCLELKNIHLEFDLVSVFQFCIEIVEDEYYVQVIHEMTKKHYISFIAAASSDRMQVVKLYPEGNAEARYKINCVRKICFYCNRDGLFSIDPVKRSDK